MPSFVTPKINTEFIFYISLVSQANANLFQTNPTLAIGDVKVSTDGGAEGNITTLPVVTPAGSKRVKVTLSAAEMNGDNIQVTFSDAAGAEWADTTINIQTSANQIDDIPLTPMRGTDSAALASVCSEARLAELDAGNLPSDIDDIKGVTDFLVVKKNTAKNNFMWSMVLSSDHVSDANSLTVTCQRSIDGGAFANWATPTATFLAEGAYKNNLAAADLNGDVIMLKFTAPTADTRKLLILTVP